MEGPSKEAFLPRGHSALIASAFRHLAPLMQQQTRDVDLDRASIATSSAQGGSEGQLLGLLLSHQRGSDDGPDGAGVYPTIGMPTNLLVDRTDVEASPAAQAVQGLPQHLIGQQARPAVVHQHQMELLRTVGVFIRLGAGNHTDVAGQALSGSGARQQPQQHRQVLQRGHHLLHTGEGDMYPRGRGAEASVTFVGDYHQCAGLGHQKVRPADPHVRSYELFA